MPSSPHQVHPIIVDTIQKIKHSPMSGHMTCNRYLLSSSHVYQDSKAGEMQTLGLHNSRILSSCYVSYRNSIVVPVTIANTVVEV